MNDSDRIVVGPVESDRWADLRRLFGPRGASEGCWCVLWRVPSSTFVADRGDGNRDRMHRLVKDGPPPGLLAYRDDEPVGWCTIAPRPAFSRLLRSPMVKGGRDEVGVWSLPCFYVARSHRHTGVATALLDAAVAYVTAQGAERVEAYPVKPGAKVPVNDAYPGFLSMFEAAGFRVVDGGTVRRAVVRRDL